MTATLNKSEIVSRSDGNSRIDTYLSNINVPIKELTVPAYGEIATKSYLSEVSILHLGDYKAVQYFYANAGQSEYYQQEVELMQTKDYDPRYEPISAVDGIALYGDYVAPDYTYNIGNMYVNVSKSDAIKPASYLPEGSIEVEKQEVSIRIGEDLITGHYSKNKSTENSYISKEAVEPQPVDIYSESLAFKYNGLNYLISQVKYPDSPDNSGVSEINEIKSYITNGVVIMDKLTASQADEIDKLAKEMQIPVDITSTQPADITVKPEDPINNVPKEVQ
jgi:hypothetical protein